MPIRHGGICCVLAMIDSFEVEVLKSSVMTAKD